MSQGFPGPGQRAEQTLVNARPWPAQRPGSWGAAQSGFGVPAQPAPWPSGPTPTPPVKRGPARAILITLIMLAAVMLGLVLYSLFSGPDYKNDDYVPPPPGDVKPFTDVAVSEVNDILTANPLYSQEIPVPVRCDLDTIDLATASDDAVHAYIDEIIACNMRVWDPPVRDTNRFELVRPIVNVYHDTVTTPCGGGGADGPNASYCSANQQVYFSRDLASAHPNLAVINQPHVIDLIMSHEFGHAVQARTVILQASAYKGRQSGDPQIDLEQSRRVEVQADCFAGLVMQSVRESVGYTQADIDRMIAAMRGIGDDALNNRPGDPGIVGNHGHGASREYWYQVGLSGTDINRCNTFTAPADYVR